MGPHVKIDLASYSALEGRWINAQMKSNISVLQINKSTGSKMRGVSTVLKPPIIILYILF